MKTNEVRQGMFINFDYHGPLGVVYDRDVKVDTIIDGVITGWERGRSYPVSFPCNDTIVRNLGQLLFDSVDATIFYNSIQRS